MRVITAPAKTGINRRAWFFGLMLGLMTEFIAVIKAELKMTRKAIEKTIKKMKEKARPVVLERLTVWQPFAIILMSALTLLILAQAPLSAQETQVQSLPASEQNERDNQSFQNRLKQWLPGKINPAQWQDLSPYEAALKAIENNLTLREVRVDARIKHAAIAEARAVFDPQFALSLNYAETDRSDRVAHLDRYKKETITIEQGQPLPQMDEEGNPVLCELAAGCPQANGELIPFGNHIPLQGGTLLCTERLADENGQCHMSAIPDNEFTTYVMLDAHRPGGFYPSDPIKASESFLTGDIRDNVVDLSVQQNLPWGGSLNLLFSINKKAAYWINNNNEFSDLREVFHNGQTLATYGSYHRPWASSLTLSASLPLPKSQDFGADNTFNTGIKRAKLQEQQSRSEIKRIINQTLLDVAQTYWELVAAKHELIVLMDNLDRLKQLQDNTQRLYQQRMLSLYDKEQIEQEFERVQLQTRQVFQGFLSQAYQLRRLMGERTQLAMPIRYHYQQQNPIGDEYGQLLNVADDYNPELEVQQYNIDLADLNLKLSENQARPDLDLNLALRASQNNSPYGYESLSDSLSQLGSPDTLLQQLQLSYRYPIANRRVKARVKQAQNTLRAQQLNLQQQQTSIAYALENALIALHSARLSTDMAFKYRDLALKTLEKALRQQELREVTEYEMVDKNRVLLQAQQQLLNARKRYKQAEAELLAQLGLLPAQYAHHTTHNALDQYRINYLQAYRQLDFFHPAENPGSNQITAPDQITAPKQTTAPQKNFGESEIKP